MESDFLEGTKQGGFDKIALENISLYLDVSLS